MTAITCSESFPGRCPPLVPFGRRVRGLPTASDRECLLSGLRYVLEFVISRYANWLAPNSVASHLYHYPPYPCGCGSVALNEGGHLFLFRSRKGELIPGQTTELIL